jgi:hypothetical protein
MRLKLLAPVAWGLLTIGCRVESSIPSSVPADLQQKQEAAQKQADDDERAMRKAAQSAKRK